MQHNKLTSSHLIQPIDDAVRHRSILIREIKHDLLKINLKICLEQELSCFHFLESTNISVRMHWRTKKSKVAP